MRMILHAHLPHDTFNAAVKDGTIGDKLSRIFEETKPESVYFTEFRGMRSALMVFEVADPSKIPFYAEPWFLTFNADVEFHPAITPQELGKANLESLAKKWL
jgi:hypothetical protein